MLPPMTLKDRRECLFRHVDVRNSTGLEIGAFFNPTVTKDEGRIEYLDHNSTEELRVGLAAHVPPGAFVPAVDHVVKSDEYYRFVDRRYDYVIANHVIEHVDNVVRWLVDLGKLLRPGGVIFLTVPDKKYNFDRYRADTQLSHLLADHFRGHCDHRERGVDLVLYYDTAYTGQPLDVKQKFDVEHLRRVYDEDTHPGRHNHVFQSETFVDRVLRPLQYMQLLPYTLLEFQPAPIHQGEFYVVLRQGAEQVKIAPESFWQPIDTVHGAVEGTVGGTVEGAIDGDRVMVQRLQAEIRSLRQSLSWRALQPVRTLLDRLRRPGAKRAAPGERSQDA
jgi:predicted SAM-dependent methyltransferase